MIRLRKVSKVKEVPLGVVNAVSWFGNNVQFFDDIRVPAYQLSPYHLKTEGCLMENIWQGSKLYAQVTPQRQVYAGQVTWQHPGEVHLTADGKPAEAYWAWRDKLYHNPHPVRYPNGYDGRRSALYSLWAINGQLTELSYTEARRAIYCPVYSQLVVQTEAFQQLREIFQRRDVLEIADIDVPDGLVVTPENYEQYLNNANVSFGHAWTIARLLLGF